jgi:hypothetical protein
VDPCLARPQLIGSLILATPRPSIKTVVDPLNIWLGHLQQLPQQLDVILRAKAARRLLIKVRVAPVTIFPFGQRWPLQKHVQATGSPTRNACKLAISFLFSLVY